MSARKLLAAGILCGCLEAQSYSLTVMADTSVAFKSIDNRVTLNDQEKVTFTATPTGATNASVYTNVLPGANSLTAPGSGTRTFLGATINNAVPPQIAAVDRVSGAPPVWYARVWPESYTNVPTHLAKSPDDCDAVLGFVDINDSGLVACAAQVNGSLLTALLAGTNSPPTRVATYSGNVALRPQLGNDGTIVIRDDQQRIVTWSKTLVWLASTIAGPAEGFASTGQAPGISRDGSIVVFAGTRTGLPKGIYVSVPTGIASRKILRIAGEGQGPISAIDDTQRVGVHHSGRMLTVTFAGTGAQGTGIYAVDATLVDLAGAGIVSLMPPIPVAMIGQTIPGGPIGAVTLYDQPNACGSVAFHAVVNGTANAVVLATRTMPNPMFTARISFVRVLGPGLTYSPAWSDANIATLAADLDTMARRVFNLGLQWDNTIREVSDPRKPVSWFDVPSSANLSGMEAEAETNPCLHAWRTDAINIYLVNSIGGAGGVCSFPLGSLPNANDMAIIAPNIKDGPVVGTMHELGHYFNLRHTHANFEGVGAGCDGGAQGDCIDDLPIDINWTGLDCGQRIAALDALWPTSSWQNRALRSNIMSYYCGLSSLSATASCGQVFRVLKSALAFRSHVLVGMPTPTISSVVAPGGSAYPGGSTLNIVGTDLPTYGAVYVRLEHQGSTSTVLSPIGMNAQFPELLAPGNHCACVYRDNQLVASSQGPPIRPRLGFQFSRTATNLTIYGVSRNPSEIVVLAFGTPLVTPVSLPGFEYQLWLNLAAATTYAFTTDPFSVFSFATPVLPAFSGVELTLQGLNASTSLTFTNDMTIRFP